MRRNRAVAYETQYWKQAVKMTNVLTELPVPYPLRQLQNSNGRPKMSKNILKKEMSGKIIIAVSPSCDCRVRNTLLGFNLKAKVIFLMEWQVYGLSEYPTLFRCMKTSNFTLVTQQIKDQFRIHKTRRTACLVLFSSYLLILLLMSTSLHGLFLGLGI